MEVTVWKEKEKYLGEEYNPFTGRYEPFYSTDSKKVWVSPKTPVKKVMKTRRVAIVSGNIIEVKNYSEDQYYNYSVPCKGGKRAGAVQKRSDKINEAKIRLRRLINANVVPSSKFVTLTFKDNIEDVKTAKNHFKKFVMRLNYLRKKEGKGNLKYIYVVEFQKRGAVHFHCIFFNMGYVKNSDLQLIWRFGYVRINIIKNVDNVGAYVVKYMQKDLVNEGLKGFDLYGRSRDLREPVEIKEPSQVGKLIEGFEKYIVYSKSYMTKYRGNIEYIQYNLSRKVRK